LTTFLFADDTQGFDCDKDLGVLINRINNELKNWAAWFRANKMVVKPGFLHDENKISTLDRIGNGNASPEQRYFRLLGVLLDET
jgi:hypothetical protein